MTLQIYTSRISSRDPDRLDITRKSGGEFGRMFAPSWDILRPALAAREKAKRLRAVADGMSGIVREVHRPGTLLSAEEIERRSWEAYVPAYLAEMRESYRVHRDVWRHMLSAERRVLVCYCVDPSRCHRTLLADILGKLGAVVGGEVMP